jgi:hypothetical protein
VVVHTPRCLVLYLPRALLLALLVASVIAASGCARTDDLPRLQDEALAVARTYQQRFDELGERAEALRQRGAALPPEVLSASKAGPTFRSALSRLTEYRSKLQQVPASLKTAAAAGDRAVMKLIDELRHDLERGRIETISELAAVESAIAAAERQPAGARGAPPADRAGASGAQDAAPTIR